MSLSLDLVAVEVGPCIVCQQKTLFNIPREVAEKINEGYSVQESWPYSTPDDREMLISGTHPACWEEMFGGSDCD